jgi:replicative DNA helicase
MDFKIHIIALSQLNRLSAGGKEPSMAEIRESGAIEQDASNILIMWDSEENDETKKALKVDKARNGKRGRMDLYFDGEHLKFSEWTEADGDCPFK